ncbi:ATP-dependent DNA helicase PIF1 [Pochonia chlamydosporia 170]|uniref:ATP-dependent DNA helicase n=1 Tax=Pochonia chlamydosporia 170 TaxID=1380566 RepID=A0A179EW16_METCM|nr:ATP-dependent DNA helicase PIF1 [Pochonia chlamydosporia 170]XP_018136778.1 ATP-dependent DNA helicase PIF1 [Pochonia chlamydosporia 170]OAQ58651.1 ATP-dependent DNA helicase PIF1 [Pochonia chlamydosporia 170]OWT42234.1 ATP-dependent DNA helicase PIF1 [Pochonia chlamydosporia 170]
MNSWGTSLHGVPERVYGCMERNEPSAWEKTRTAHVVPPTERGMDDEESLEIGEVLAALNQGEDVSDGRCQEPKGSEMDDRDRGKEAERQHFADPINEVTSSGMFTLDGPPDVADAEKLRFVRDAVGKGAFGDQIGPGAWVGSAHGRQRKAVEPYVQICRGNEFADSFDAFFFAKTFPTLFPFGIGGPRLIEEAVSEFGSDSHEGEAGEVEAAAANNLLSSRNMSLHTWAGIVLRRHGGRFATHHIFAFLVFNMGVRSRNRRVSMLSVTRKGFRKVERIVRSLSVERLEAARVELESSGVATDAGVKELLRSLSLYGFRQPMSRELRLSMRRKIKSLILQHGVPAIWFTLNPNDITNPVKLRLAAYRSRGPEEAEAFLRDLDVAYKRVRLAISDPMSSALFFHREMTLFFDHYVKVGEESVFGRISQYYGAVETNERGALHLHGLLWLHGNMNMSSIFADAQSENQRTYRERIVRYVDSVFSEELDQEGFCAIKAERSVTADISTLLGNSGQLSGMFDEEANFCAGATQIHTHSPTCIKYSLGKKGRSRDLCRFKAPWRLVEKTAFTEDGVLHIRRNHGMVNRWNKAMAVGLRHNHDISFIATQCKTMALIYYVTNYATKVEDPVWKRIAAAAEALPVLQVEEQGSRADTEAGAVSENGGRNKTRQFLMRVANRIFTDRPLSQVEVIAYLLGYPSEFTSNSAWTFLNVSLLYWHVFKRWRLLRQSSGAEAEDESTEETVLVEEAGQRISAVDAYQHRGYVLRGLCLYDYMSLVRLKRKGKGKDSTPWGEVPFESGWPLACAWTQTLRRPGKHATVCLDGYLSMDFAQDDDGPCYRRAAVQHLALFVPWESFLSAEDGDINNIWNRERGLLPGRLSFVANNIQLLRRSAEDAKRDARQWAASSADSDRTDEAVSIGLNECNAEATDVYRSDSVGDATRLIDVVRMAAGVSQITAGSKEIMAWMQQLCRFQQSSLCSSDELRARVIDERGVRRIELSGRPFSRAEIPAQKELRAIKSQQTAASRERERMIQGIQHVADNRDRATTNRSAAIEDVLNGFGEQDIRVTAAHPKGRSLDSSPQAKVRLGPSTSFLQAGRRLVELFTLNRRQSVAFLLICRRLDSIRGHGAAAGQLCEFIGGEGGTGKSRVIEALVELFASAGISNRVLVTATSGTAAAQINGITIHSACGFLKDRVSRVGVSRDIDGANLSNSAERFINGQSRMDWQEKYLLIIDEVSMLGARTLYAVNERLCRLRGCQRDFGGIPIVLFCGDFRQFRPVQERSILLPSTAVTWDEDTSFGPEQRHQHDRAHALWRRFTTVVMLDEQVRAAGDPELQQLLKRIRRGVQNRTDLDLLNSRCYREDRPIPWETGITVVTPLNRNRWNLNMEATLSFQRQHRETMRIFISEHRWKDGQASEEEAILMLNHGDNSAIPVPAIFMFVPGMPIVVNHNTHQGLKLVNGASYTALDVILDKAYPGHRISADTMLHFGSPAGILLAAKTTQEFHFVGMPPGTILLTPMSVSIRAQRNRPWQVRDVARKGLPCAAAFACTDYKVQAKTLERVALELRGTRTTNVNGQMVASQCDPYSLYVQLSRCPSLDGIMLVSKVRERDLVGNTVPEDMTAAEERLEALSKKTMQEAHDLIG